MLKVDDVVSSSPHYGCTGYPASRIFGHFLYPISNRISGFICRISCSSVHKIVDIVSNENYFFYLKNRENKLEEKIKKMKKKHYMFYIKIKVIFSRISGKTIGRISGQITTTLV